MCVGDCGGRGHVTVVELLTLVKIAIGDDSLNQCPSADGNHDGQITIDELLTAVSNALNGCPTAGSNAAPLTERGILGARVCPSRFAQVGAVT